MRKHVKVEYNSPSRKQNMHAILFLVTCQYQQVYVNINKRMPSFPLPDSEQQCM